MAELKLHLCYSGMVQISVQAVTPNPHRETFLKLDLEYEITCPGLRSRANFSDSDSDLEKSTPTPTQTRNSDSDPHQSLFHMSKSKVLKQ